jgi:hypothetical protein
MGSFLPSDHWQDQAPRPLVDQVGFAARKRTPGQDGIHELSLRQALRRWPSISNAYAARSNQNEPVVGNTRMTRILVNGTSDGSFCAYAEMVRGGARCPNLDASKNKKATRLQNGWLGLTKSA